MTILRRISLYVFCFLLALSWAGCSPPQVTASLASVQVTADGHSFQLQMPAGSTVEEALAKAGLALGSLDRVEPPLYTVLSDGARVNVVRVEEKFEVEQVVVPFERQTLRNEALPEGETRLSQPGANGLNEVTYRSLYENGVELSKSVVRTIVLQEATPEIVMVGSQTPFLSLPITGRLVYLSAGNAWMMEKNTGNRRAVVTSGDLDGRVFMVSPDGKWLLYTRNPGVEGTINTLWAARLAEGADQIVEFKVANVIHFAGWSADSTTVAFSTVEPRATAPGWQANNDLTMIGISANGFLSKPRPVTEVNAGGVYGWWGTSFAWAPDGKSLVYSRPDSIGLVNSMNGETRPLLELLPLQTGGDWAWTPGVGWGPDGKVLYTVLHTAPENSPSPEVSPVFDLAAIPLEGGAPVTLVSQVGMFAYPVTSPLQAVQRGEMVENAFQVAFLQAITPGQSETSRYRLVVVDRDGSNRQVVFPPDGATGLDPQRVSWSPQLLEDEGAFMIALVYQQNIWLVNMASGLAQQITGDGQTTRLDWR